uniref:Uncharacterized protein n=1 Tax=Eutreptiella gymnastica TaxID=73025 RepID=A0A7S4LBU3_9EUGL
MLRLLHMSRPLFPSSGSKMQERGYAEKWRGFPFEIHSMPLTGPDTCTNPSGQVNEGILCWPMCTLQLLSLTKTRWPHPPQYHDRTANRGGPTWSCATSRPSHAEASKLQSGVNGILLQPRLCVPMQGSSEPQGWTITLGSPQ